MKTRPPSARRRRRLLPVSSVSANNGALLAAAHAAAEEPSAHECAPEDAGLSQRDDCRALEPRAERHVGNMTADSRSRPIRPITHAAENRQYEVSLIGTECGGTDEPQPIDDL